LVENDVVDDARSRHRVCQRVIVEQRITGGVVHMQVSTIGVDLAKNVFQVHGVDNAGKVVITRQLRRKQARAPGAAPASRADRPSWATAVVVRWSLEISDHAARDQALFLIGFGGARRLSELVALMAFLGEAEKNTGGAPPRLRALSTADDDATRQKPSSPN